MIKTTPFVNPFRKLAKNPSGLTKVVANKGKIYEQVVRKKCQPKT